MKKSVFAISLLSLAIAGSNQALAAEASSQSPQECVIEGGQGESLQEWGMWCGVGTFLAALSEQEPTAAGPGDGPDLDLNINPPGRGDADEFDPEANQVDDDPVTPAPVPEPEPEPEPELVTPHIVMPAGEYVGYFASADREYVSDTDSTVTDGGGMNVISNQRTGGFQLSLQEYSDGYGDVLTDEQGYGDSTPAQVDYARSERDGSPLDSRSYSSDVEEEGAYVRLEESENERGEFYGSRRAREEDESHFIAGTEPEVFEEEPREPPSDPVLQALTLDDRERDILKNYWSGRFGTNRFGEAPDTFGVFVAGELTPLDDILERIVGDVEAVYSGNSAYGLQSVRLEVDFGEQRFTGEFGDIQAFIKSSLGIADDKDMSFTAEGLIQGVHLISESVSTGEGFVQGSFFNPNADVIGGAYDITKDGDRIVDVFTAAEGENARILIDIDQ